MVRAKRRARRKEGPPVDPEVEKMFDEVWEAFLQIAEEEVYYDVEAPLTTEKVLEKVEASMYVELKEELEERLTEVLCDACYCVPIHFLNYIFDDELPTRGDLADCISEYMETCESRETLDDYVSCINEHYDCYLLLNNFFDALPRLLEVKVVEGDIIPDLCSDKSTMEEAVQNTAWYVGVRATESYGGWRIEEDYYGTRDGRVMVIRLGLMGYWCDEGFEGEVLPKLTGRLKELSGRPDLVVYVYGDPPVDLKSISHRKVATPPKP